MKAGRENIAHFLTDFAQLSLVWVAPGAGESAPKSKMTGEECREGGEQGGEGSERERD